MNELFIGLMSGTSMDGTDAVLTDFSASSPQLLASHHRPFAPALRTEIAALAHPGVNEIERLGRMDVLLAHEYAEAVLTILSCVELTAAQIRAIGSHGQTIRHVPIAEVPFTLQIGDPNTLSHLTGITVVADFRRRDIAASGQGAPLVPAFHAEVFRSPSCSRAVLNIGGMANLSILPSDPELPVTGFDTGPGNVLMDIWAQQHLGQPMDRDGLWAASGKCIPTLLKRLLEDAFFQLPPPKSTGRELFNAEWLRSQLKGDEAPADVQATLCELTVSSVVEALNRHAAETAEVMVCGGGAYNETLTSRLAARLPGVKVSTTAEYGIPPQWVEATAFAWLARQTLNGLPGNLPTVTGAKQPVVLGGIYPHSP